MLSIDNTEDSGTGPNGERPAIPTGHNLHLASKVTAGVSQLLGPESLSLAEGEELLKLLICSVKQRGHSSHDPWKNAGTISQKGLRTTVTWLRSRNMYATGKGEQNV